MIDFTEIEKDFIRRNVLPDFDWTWFEIPTEPIPLEKPIYECKVALITTSGAYLRQTQQPFETKSSLGDDTFRVIPNDIAPEEIALAHPGYDTIRALQDLDCVFPLALLNKFKEKSVIGAVAPRHFSFIGYIPRTERLIWKVAPVVGRTLLKDKVDLAILVPA